MELKFDLFLYYTAWICWHFNFAINVWDHKLLWYFIYKLWTLYNFCHAGCWHILLWIKKKMCCQRPVKWLLWACFVWWFSRIYSMFIIWKFLQWTFHQQTSANSNSTVHKYTCACTCARAIITVTYWWKVFQNDIVTNWFISYPNAPTWSSNDPFVTVNLNRKSEKQSKQTSFTHFLLKYLCVTRSLIKMAIQPIHFVI